MGTDTYLARGVDKLWHVPEPDPRKKDRGICGALLVDRDTRPEEPPPISEVCQTCRDMQGHALGQAYALLIELAQKRRARLAAEQDKDAGAHE